MDYYMKNLNALTTNEISEFEKVNSDGKKEYTRLIIDEGYRQKIWYPYAKFSFVLERTEENCKAVTLTELKKTYIFNSLISEYYEKNKDTKEEVEIKLDNNHAICIRAQSVRDVQVSNYDGSHCGQYYKITGFIISPRNIE